jgi:hypothetical protein
METILKDTHLSTETLEEFVQGRLTATQVAGVSEHLFECDACNERYEQEVEFRAKFRKSLKGKLSAEKNRLKLPFGFSFAVMPASLMAAAAAVILAIFLVPRPSIDNSPVFAELTAYRDAGAVTAPASRSLILHVDTTGLPEGGGLRAEIADSGGGKVWSGPVSRQNGRPEVSVIKRLPAGQYWVRLFAGNDPELLREFSLRLK